MDIQRIENIEQLQHAARTKLVDFLREDASGPILLLCSGGSALDLFRDIQEDCFGSHITIGVLDERYSRDEAVNNFAQLRNTDFFKTAVCAGVRYIDTRPQEGETMERLAHRFERELHTWRKNNPEGVIIITQGIGPDGHTAGIMPFPEDPERFHELFENQDVWVRGYDAGNKNQHPLRITATITFLKTINHSIVYCVGENKRAALKQVIAEQGTCAGTPARVIRDMKNVTFFTDITF